MGADWVGKTVTPTKAFKDLVNYGDIKRSGFSMRLGAIKSEFERARRIGVWSHNVEYWNFRFLACRVSWSWVRHFIFPTNGFEGLWSIQQMFQSKLTMRLVLCWVQGIKTRSFLYWTDTDELPTLCGFCLQDKSSLWENRHVSMWLWVIVISALIARVPGKFRKRIPHPAVENVWGNIQKRWQEVEHWKTGRVARDREREGWRGRARQREQLVQRSWGGEGHRTLVVL